MKIKSIASLLVILMTIFILTSCKTSPKATDSLNDETVQMPAVQHTDGNSADNNLVSLLKQDDLRITDDLISSYFRYYCLNNRELYLLPAFNSPEQADWDQFTLYIYTNFVYPKNDGKYNNLDDVLTKDKFAKTVYKYFGEINYTDRSSLYLTYDSGIYTRKPGDETGRAYYRLTDISKNADGIYTATFDALRFGELDDESTPNIKAIQDAAGAKERLQMKEFDKTVLDIFLKPNYSQILKMAQKVTIKFLLSDDNEFPFIYKFCNITEY